ncbi:MAG: hypothetical protein QGD90_12225 [Candidatus Hydrogenedentes bacterium]|nr:hypothetical protein [Candidatus Hydrogenedentota bacterium]
MQFCFDAADIIEASGGEAAVYHEKKHRVPRRMYEDQLACGQFIE